MLVSTLPDLSTLDRETLQAMLVAEHEEHIATHARLQSRESEIEHLKLLLSQLRRMQFGRKSEKLERQIEQLELRLEDLQQSQPSESAPASKGPRPSAAAASAAIDTPAKPARRALPAHLPRTTQTHLPKSTTCPDCGGELRKFGEDISEMLDYLPANFVVIRHVRPKLSCGHCERIVQAPAPSRPIVWGGAAPGYWPMCWLASTATIFRFIDSLRSMGAWVWSWNDRRWRIRWEAAVSYSIHWWKRCVVT